MDAQPGDCMPSMASSSRADRHIDQRRPVCALHGRVKSVKIPLLFADSDCDLVPLCPTRVLKLLLPLCDCLGV